MASTISATTAFRSFRRFGRVSSVEIGPLIMLSSSQTNTAINVLKQVVLHRIHGTRRIASELENLLHHRNLRRRRIVSTERSPIISNKSGSDHIRSTIYSSCNERNLEERGQLFLLSHRSAGVHQTSLICEDAVATDESVSSDRLTEHFHAQHIRDDFFRFLDEHSQECTTRSKSVWSNATWSLQAIKLPSEDRRSSMRCTTTSSGRALRICCSSVSRNESGAKIETCGGNGYQQSILITCCVTIGQRAYQQSHGQQNGSQRSRCGRQEYDRLARFRTLHKSFQILLCKPSNIYWSISRIHQRRCFPQTEHLYVTAQDCKIRIAIS